MNYRLSWIIVQKISVQMYYKSIFPHIYCYFGKVGSMFVHICDLQMRKEGITLFGKIARFPNKASKLGFHFWKVRSVFVHVCTCYDTISFFGKRARFKIEANLSINLFSGSNFLKRKLIT